MVNNKKIKSIRKMPEGNNIVLIWVLLIAQAGESNKTGALYLTDTIPFTVDELAIQLDFEKQILQLALLVLEKYNMIEIFDEIIYIKNWEKYQNETGMEKIREQTRARVARCRENKKVLAIESECNATVTLPVTQSNATELELRTKNQEQELKKHTIDDFFEIIWKLYPRKLGKGHVKNTHKQILYKIGVDEMTRCIDRYKDLVSGKEEQFIQHGSTFFISGYVDFLDKNYTEQSINTTLTKTGQNSFKF